jgi:exodeoxyribonuclease VII large subunit
MPPLGAWLEERTQKLDELFERLINGEVRVIERQTTILDHLSHRITPAIRHILQKTEQHFVALGGLLESYSYARVLERGFAFVTKGDKMFVSSKAMLMPHEKAQVHFHDGQVDVEIL